MKRGLTVEEHRALGVELSQIRERLLHLGVKVGNAYPLRNKAHKHLFRAQEQVDEARSTLEDQLCEEHGTAAAAGVYYPRGAVAHA